MFHKFSILVAVVVVVASVVVGRGGGTRDKEMRQQLIDLQNQLASYKGELKSREQSSAELRESLKEAVALLKPLQDAVAKAETEKSDLQVQLQNLEQQRMEEYQSTQQQLNQRDKQIRELEDFVQELKAQVEEQKQLAMARQSLLNMSTTTASPGPHSAPTTPSDADAASSSLTKIQRAREELRRKRESEGNLKQLLQDAQSRFHSLHQQNEDVAARNRELQGRLRDAEQQLMPSSESSSSPSMQHQLERYQRELAQRDEIVMSLRKELERAKNSVHTHDTRDLEAELEQLRKSQQRVQELDAQLLKMRSDLAQKEQSERILNKSLKEALGLLKPLQMHLEDAEKEKMEISKELRNLRKRFRQLQMGEAGDDQSRSTMGLQDVSVELIRVKEELEETVRQLELENSQLHDALEDLSEADKGKAADAKLRQKFVELNSRYEVTQNRLEDANVENHALVKALKQKELEEKRLQEELRQLKHQFDKSQGELQNAKAIARSALVKVEELTMANVEQLSLSREGPIDLDLAV